MRISKGLRDKLNKIAIKYSKWLYPKEIQGFYKEIAELGVVIPAWGYWDKDNAHPYTVDGEEVENSMVVFDVYEGSYDNPKNEYNIYFS